jgi:alginate O-acetyltransferase complex protein AlgI
MSSTLRVSPKVHWPKWVALALPLIVLSATPADWPRWGFMWLLAFAIYSACKLITWRANSTYGVPFWRQCAYLVAWPGLDAAAFLHSDPSRPPIRPTTQEWAAALAKALLGIMIFWTAQYWISTDSPILLGWAGMVGVVLMLHFGVFHLLSCGWRAVGVNARPLMVAPLKSTSVTEFWSDRWNRAFRDFTHQFMFRPLTRRWGVKAALLIGFFFSGLVHDLVISVPAGAGYGGPTLFFII